LSDAHQYNMTNQVGITTSLLASEIKFSPHVNCVHYIEFTRSFQKLRSKFLVHSWILVSFISYVHLHLLLLFMTS